MLGHVDDCWPVALRAKVMVLGTKVFQPEFAAGAVCFYRKTFTTIQNKMRPTFADWTHGQVVFVLDIDIQELPLKLGEHEKAWGSCNLRCHR